MRITYPSCSKVSSFIVTALVLANAARSSNIWAAYLPPAEGYGEAVATDSSEATRVAFDVLDKGGNAIDAAIAAVLTLGVVSPSACGLGGGGFALVYSANNHHTVAIDFRERAPSVFSAEKLSNHIKADAGDTISTGVMGEPAGLDYLAKHYGSKSLKEDAAHAIALAENGFYISSFFAGRFARFGQRLFPDTELFQAIKSAMKKSPHGLLGEKIRRPKLASFLRQFSEKGADYVYRGEVAKQIVAAVQKHGGELTLSDLDSYRVVERQPLLATVSGYEIQTFPAPSAGGLMLLENALTFGLGSESSLFKMGFGSSLYFHTLAESMRFSVMDRLLSAGDPDLFQEVEKKYHSFLEMSRIKNRRLELNPLRSHTVAEMLSREGGTSHLVVADRFGNIVTLTTTINSPYGSGVDVPELGILLNDELYDFTRPSDLITQPSDLIVFNPKKQTSFDSKKKPEYGADKTEQQAKEIFCFNRPTPLARPSSSMTPVIVWNLATNKPALAAGGSGGPRIATGVTQAVLCRLIFAHDPMTCVSSPRIHVETGPKLIVEKEIANDVLTGLEQRGESWTYETGVSGVQMITWEDSPGGGFKIQAASDPRRGGYALVR